MPKTRRLLGACLATLGTTTALHLTSDRTTVAPAAESTARPDVAQVSSARDARLLEAASAARARPVSRSRRPAPRPGAMPVGDRPGWRQVLAEDFRGRSLPAAWGRYGGRPGGNPHGWWEPSHAVLRGGDLHLVGDWRGGTFVTGGVMAVGVASTYGKYEVRFKVSRAAGVSYALLLWPARDSWPRGGEIDFAEDGGGGRRSTTATLHYGAANHQQQHEVRADFAHFQTVGVEWTPGRITYTLNGRPWAAVAGSHVPSGPMRLALQLEAGRGTAWSPAPSRATPRTADLVVDWVVGYRRK